MTADVNLGGITFEGKDKEELGQHLLSYNFVGRFLHDHSIRGNVMKIRMTGLEHGRIHVMARCGYSHTKI